MHPAKRLSNLTSVDPDNQGPRSAIGGAAVWSFAGNTFVQGMTLCLFLLITRYVDRESFGIMAVCLTTVEFLRRLCLEPIAMAVKANPSATDADFNKAFSVILALSAIMSAAVALGAAPLATLLSIPSIADILPVVALLLLAIGLSQVHTCWLGRHMFFRAIAMRGIFATILGGAVGVGMAVAGFGVWSLVAQQLTLSTVSAVVLWTASPWKPELSLSRRWIQDIAPPAFHIATGRFWLTVQQESDIYFVSGFLGPTAAGIYNGAKRVLLAAFLAVTAALSPVAISSLANTSDEGDRERLGMGGLAAMNLATCPVFLGLAIIAEPLVAALLPPEWADSGKVLRILAIGGYAGALHAYCGAVLMVADQARDEARCSMLGAALAVVSYALFAGEGILAVATSYTFAALATLPIRLGLIRKILGVGWSEVMCALAPSWLAAGAMSAMIWTTWKIAEPPNAWLHLLYAVSIGAIVYLACLWSISKRQLVSLIELMR